MERRHGRYAARPLQSAARFTWLRAGIPFSHSKLIYQKPLFDRSISEGSWGGLKGSIGCPGISFSHSKLIYQKPLFDRSISEGSWGGLGGWGGGAGQFLGAPGSVLKGSIGGPGIPFSHSKLIYQKTLLDRSFLEGSQWDWGVPKNERI